MIATAHLPPVTTKTIYIRSSRNLSVDSSVHRRHGFLLRNIPAGFTIVRSYPKDAWNAEDQILQRSKHTVGHGSWHASLQLGAYLSIQTNLPELHTIFLSLGCVLDDTYAQPKAWCVIDNVIWPHSGGDIERFQHNASFSKLYIPRDSWCRRRMNDDLSSWKKSSVPQGPSNRVIRWREDNVSQGLCNKVFRYGVGLSIEPEKVIGQNMFVVHLEQVEEPI
jgi:hypothetical protein